MVTYDRQHMMCIRLRLLQAREARGLSQGAVAKLLGISRPTVSWIEGGTQRLTVELLLALCDVYTVDPGWILRIGYDIIEPIPDLKEARRGLKPRLAGKRGKK